MDAERSAVIRKLDELRLIGPGRSYGLAGWILEAKFPNADNPWEFWACFATARGAIRFFDNYAPPGTALALRRDDGNGWEIEFKPAAAP